MRRDDVSEADVDLHRHTSRPEAAAEADLDALVARVESDPPAFDGGWVEHNPVVLDLDGEAIADHRDEIIHASGHPVEEVDVPGRPHERPTPYLQHERALQDHALRMR